MENKTNEDTSMINNEVHGIILINTKPDEVLESYKFKISKLIEEYTLKEKVQTSIQTKIILSDDEPINLQPQRLVQKEKQILDEQIKDWIKVL